MHKFAALSYIVYMGFLIHKKKQILKRFAGTFRWAQTSYFWWVISSDVIFSNKSYVTTFKMTLLLSCRKVNQEKKTLRRKLTTHVASWSFPNFGRINGLEKKYRYHLFVRYYKLFNNHLGWSFTTSLNHKILWWGFFQADSNSCCSGTRWC